MADEYRLQLRKCLRAARHREQGNKIDLEKAADEVQKIYKITQQKKQQLMDFLQKSVEKTKIKEWKKPVEPEYPKIVHKNTAHEEMRQHAEELPTTPIGKYMELDIIKRVHSTKMQQAYPETFAKVMAEIREEFFQITHGIGVNSRVRPVDGTNPHIRLLPYKYLGKSIYYADYLRNKDELKSKLFSTYPLMRKILKKCVTELPEILVDFTKYRDTSYEHTKLMDILTDEIVKGGVFIKEFYDKIMELAESDKTKLPKGGKLHYWRTGK